MKNLLTSICLAGSVFSMAASAADGVRVCLNWAPGADHIPLYAARQQGAFADADLAVDLRPGGGSGDAVAKLAAGECEVAVADFSAVIAARARGLDGMAFAAGMLGGVYAWAEFFPGMDQWIAENSVEATLPGLTGIPMGWWVLAFVAFLALAGWGMALAEKRFAGLRP